MQTDAVKVQGQEQRMIAFVKSRVRDLCMQDYHEAGRICPRSLDLGCALIKPARYA